MTPAAIQCTPHNKLHRAPLDVYKLIPFGLLFVQKVMNVFSDVAKRSMELGSLSDFAICVSRELFGTCAISIGIAMNAFACNKLRANPARPQLWVMLLSHALG